MAVKRGRRNRGSGQEEGRKVAEEEIRAGEIVPFGEERRRDDHREPRGLRRGEAGCGILEGEAGFGRQAEAFERQQPDIRRRLLARDLVAAGERIEEGRRRPAEGGRAERLHVRPARGGGDGEAEPPRPRRFEKRGDAGPERDRPSGDQRRVARRLVGVERRDPLRRERRPGLGRERRHPLLAAGDEEEPPIGLAAPVPARPGGGEGGVEGEPVRLLRLRQRAVDVEDQRLERRRVRFLTPVEECHAAPAMGVPAARTAPEIIGAATGRGRKGNARCRFS